uniref:Uncharacterized protein n=1 Tax=Amphiprion percula TaxID=161767 RepID=A0A3P8SX23_AMPPE
VIGPNPAWPSSPSLTSSAPKTASHRNDDIDKLLMDLENLSQSMSHPRNIEPPLPAKTRKRDGASHLTMNGLSSKTPQSLAPPQVESNEAVVGEEEDGALLLRILESIESFAQELVDSGAGSTGSAERKCGKEREVMRLLQDTLATTGRTDTPVEITNPPAAPTAPSVHTIVPAPEHIITQSHSSSVLSAHPSLFHLIFLCFSASLTLHFFQSAAFRHPSLFISVFSPALGCTFVFPVSVLLSPAVK